MDGKKVILSVFIMSLVMAQIQVEAKTCCPTTTSRNIYITCRLSGASRPACASVSGCRIITGNKCPKFGTHDILEKSGDAVNEYCKLGCASTVCSALTTHENSDVSEIVNEAVNRCVKACSTLCSKGPKNAVETA